MEYLLYQKDNDIHNAQTLDNKFKMLVKGFSDDNKDDDVPKDIKEDDISEFVPGQPWMSQEERRRRDLAITMHQIEHSILKQKVDSYQVAYEILLHAEDFEREGRNMKQEIRRVLSDPQKMEEKEDFKDFLKNETEINKNPEDIKIPNVEGKRITVQNAFKAFTEYLQKDEKRMQDKKEAVHKKTEDYDIKKEDKKKKKKEAFNDISYLGSSYGSTMFKPLN